jgi:hypothetical protein
MVSALRGAGSITTIDPSGSGTYVEFLDQDNETVAFFHNVAGSPYYIGPVGTIADGDLVLQTLDRRGNPLHNLLGRSIATLTFTYLESDMTTQATQAAMVQAINIEMTVADPEGELPGTLPIASLAYCRTIMPIGGMAWVVDLAPPFDAVRIDAAGQRYARVGGLQYPYSVSVNPTDDTCWISDRLIYPGGPAKVLKVDKDGNILFRVENFSGHPNVVTTFAYGLDVNHTDGSCWVAAGEFVVKISSTGDVLFRRPQIADANFFMSVWSVSVDQRDGSCWASDLRTNRVVKFDAAGNTIAEYNSRRRPNVVAVDPRDGSCWVGTTREVIKLDASGTEVRRLRGFKDAAVVAVDPRDGSCWTIHFIHNGAQLVKLDTNGDELFRTDGFTAPNSLSVNPVDGSCWVTDRIPHEVVIVDANGTVRQRISNLDTPFAVSVDPEEE